MAECFGGADVKDNIDEISDMWVVLVYSEVECKKICVQTHSGMRGRGKRQEGDIATAMACQGYLRMSAAVRSTNRAHFGAYVSFR